MTCFITKKWFETRFSAGLCLCINNKPKSFVLFIYDLELRVFQLHLSNRWNSGKATITEKYYGIESGPEVWLIKYSDVMKYSNQLGIRFAWTFWMGVMRRNGMLKSYLPLKVNDFYGNELLMLMQIVKSELSVRWRIFLGKMLLFICLQFKSLSFVRNPIQTDK